MITTDDLRQCAMALPEVEEISHFRFRVPVWKVRGRTFMGMGSDETTAVFCMSEQAAEDAAAEMTAERVRALAEQAWRQQAPKRLVAEQDRQRQ
jgi:hypothetical protein